MKLFQQIGRSKWYWLSMIALAAALEAAALYYQYVLNQYPCVLCIHVRIWVLGFIVVGALGLALQRWRAGIVAANVLGLIAAIGLAERSWQLLATERGWSNELACSMESGLPFWFALDKWFPAVFAVQTSCGYTPVIVGDITMAEALMGISAAAIVTFALVSVAAFRLGAPAEA